jgi:sulfoxide reductase heme-binding subunit YedZ
MAPGPRPSARARRWAMAGVVGVGLIPLAALGLAAWRDDLGANPIEAVTHETGQWTLRCLLASLAITPLRRWTGWGALAPYRRTLGLLAFTYACLHFTTYVALDLFFDWSAIVEDVIERPYVTAGLTAFLCLLPLALTSTRAWMRRLGRRWVLLHRLAYAAGIAGVVHYIWLTKADLRLPLLYAGVLAVLLAARLYRLPRKREARAASGTRASSP